MSGFPLPRIHLEEGGWEPDTSISAPNIFPRLVAKGGLDLYGEFAPEGTEVTGNAWVVQRDPGIYGPDAEVFRPGRWLDSDGGLGGKAGDRAADYANKYSLTFGYGARGCLGRDLALMELYKAPLQFLRTFRLRPETAAADTGRPRPGQRVGRVGGVAAGGPGRYVYKGGISYWEDMWITIDRRAPVV